MVSFLQSVLLAIEHRAQPLAKLAAERGMVSARGLDTRKGRGWCKGDGGREGLEQGEDCRGREIRGHEGGAGGSGGLWRREGRGQR